MNIEYKDSVTIAQEDVKKLYENVKWTSYTKDMPRLVEAINRSLKVVSAWDNNKLVGLIRVVGDGVTIIYIQDILVLENYQNLGIGSALLNTILTMYQDVRQKVLLTNDSIEVRAFYEKHNFVSCDKGDLVAFANLRMI